MRNSTSNIDVISMGPSHWIAKM